MDRRQLQALLDLLRQWEAEEFDLPQFISGTWSRRNLKAMMEDVETRLKDLA